MMMPANYSAIAENEMTYVNGGFDLAAYLAPMMTAQNWQNLNTNLIKVVGAQYYGKVFGTALTAIFGGAYTPGQVLGAYKADLKGIWDNANQNGMTEGWGFAKAVLNTGLQVVGGLSAIYALGSKSHDAAPLSWTWAKKEFTVA